MEIPNRLILTALVFASSLALAPAQAIKTLPLNDYTVYHLKVGTDKVTTVAFPQPITAMEGSGMSLDPKTPAPMLLSYHPGDRFFSIRALNETAKCSLNIICNRSIYVLEFVADKEPFQSVRFYSTDASSGLGKASGTGKADPTRLLGILDKAKAYPLLSEQYPEMVSQIDKAIPYTSSLYKDFDVILTRVYRFDPEDTLVFQIELVNRTSHPILYVPQSLAVRVGSTVYWSALADASGVMPAGIKDPKTGKIIPGHSNAYFVICGTSSGGRNQLSVTNKFNVLVFRQENL